MNRDKEPKRWQCKDENCLHLNKKCRSLYKNDGIKNYRIYVCYKCKGSIKESDEWLAWHDRETERLRPAMIAFMESREARWATNGS